MLMRIIIVACFIFLGGKAIYIRASDLILRHGDCRADVSKSSLP